MATMSLQLYQLRVFSAVTVPSSLPTISVPTYSYSTPHLQHHCRLRLSVPNLFLRQALTLAFPRLAGRTLKRREHWITIIITAIYFMMSHATITISSATTIVCKFMSFFSLFLLHLSFGPLVLDICVILWFASDFSSSVLLSLGFFLVLGIDFVEYISSPAFFQLPSPSNNLVRYMLTFVL